MKFMEGFSNLKIKTKLLTLTSLMMVLALGIVGIAFYNQLQSCNDTIRLVEQSTRNSYDMNLKTQVNTAVSLLNSIYKEYQNGSLTLEQARELGAETVRNMHYGSEGYFWIDTVNGDNVVLSSSETEQKNRYAFRDVTGKLVVQEFIQNAVEGNGKFVDYWYPKNGKSTPEKKRGYSELFKPFNWVIGTGNYIGDIEQDIAIKRNAVISDMCKKTALYAILLGLFLLLLLHVVLKVSKNISVPLQKAVDVAIQISDGEMGVHIEEDMKKRGDEVGDLAVSLEKMRHSICSLFKSLEEKANALEKEKELLETTLVSVGDGVISTDENWNINLFNAAAESLTGWERTEAAGRFSEEIFHLVQEKDRVSYFDSFKSTVLEGHTVTLENDTVLLTKGGGELPVEVSIAPITEKDRKVVGAVFVFRDATEKQKKIEEIKYLGYHDPLTGLYNRRFLEKQIKLADQPENFPISLIMADVNGLKLFNDAYGHSAGDELIQRAAEALKRECRSNDIIARVGGDEFIILLLRTNSKQALMLTERIKHSIEASPDQFIYLSISFGCAEKTSPGENLHDLMQRADENMYKHKLTESEAAKRKIVDSIVSRLYDDSVEGEDTYIAISNLCARIGKKLKMDQHDIRELKTAGLLHDIGKVTIGSCVLCKESDLTESDWTEIKRHPEAGYHILKALNEMAEISEFVLSHHERWDGTGYPRGLKGEEIPLPSRIIAVADAYYAMISDRPYRKALTVENAVDEIIRNAGTQFDPKVVDAFLKCIQGEQL